MSKPDLLANTPGLARLAERFKTAAAANPDLVQGYINDPAGTLENYQKQQPALAAVMSKMPPIPGVAEAPENVAPKDRKQKEKEKEKEKDGPKIMKRKGPAKVRRTKKTQAEEDDDDDDNAPPKPGDPPRIRVREVFMEILYKFVATVSDLFPECEATRDKLRLLHAAKQLPQSFNRIVHEYHVGMTPFYDVILSAKDCTDPFERTRILEPFLRWCKEGSPNGDDTVLGRILRDIDLADKWYTYEDDLESQDGIFSFVHQLNSFARLAESLPPRLLKRVEKFASVYSDPEKKPTRMQETLRLSRRILHDLPDEEKAQLFDNIEVVMEVVGGPGVLVDVMTESGMPMPNINLTQEFKEAAALSKSGDPEYRKTVMSNFERGSDALLELVSDDATNDDDVLIARLEEHNRMRFQAQNEAKKVLETKAQEQTQARGQTEALAPPHQASQASVPLTKGPSARRTTTTTTTTTTRGPKKA